MNKSFDFEGLTGGPETGLWEVMTRIPDSLVAYRKLICAAHPFSGQAVQEVIHQTP